MVDTVTSALPELVETATSVRGMGAVGALVFLVIGGLLVRRKLPRKRETEVLLIQALRDVSLAAIGKTQARDKEPRE